MNQIPDKDRMRVRRVPKRGHYDNTTIYGILDKGYVCHIGLDTGDHPVVIPMIYGRIEDELFIHGATKSRLMQDSIKNGKEICLTVTLLDGIVLARSAFHHSMNYRSVVVIGKPYLVEAADRKMAALKAISDNMLPDRWEEVRLPNATEMKATTVVGLKIADASAKIRTGPPSDDQADYDLNIWAGVLPMQMAFGKPESDPQLKGGSL